MIFLKAFRSFRYALNGLRTVWREEHSFQIEVVISIFVLIGCAYFGFSLLELSLVVIALILVLAAEIINTALEDVCDYIQPAHDEKIGRIKDTMAAFVFVIACGAAILGLLVILGHFSGGLDKYV